MQLKDLTWEQQIKHVPLENTTREMLLSVIGGLVKRIEALEKPVRAEVHGAGVVFNPQKLKSK